MITKDFAHRFAHEWIEAWNAHDLSWILSHYAEDIEMTSPFIVNLLHEPTGTLRDRAAVGAYWTLLLEQMPELRFELIEVLFGVDSICLYYQSVPGLRAIEWLYFGPDEKVIKAIAHYNG